MTDNLVDLGTRRRERDAVAREPWISKSQAAAHLAVNVRTIERWQVELDLPFLRVGNRNRYRRSQLDAWLAAQDAAARCGERSI